MSTEPGMPPKPEPMGELPPELAPQIVEVEPPPPKEKVDNTISKVALQFLEVGVPLQDGHPDEDPNKLLDKIRKEQS